MSFANIRFALAGVAALLGVGAATSAPTTTGPVQTVHVSNMGPVQLTQGVYHRAVCSKIGLRSGMAHCHAHVVTDAHGKIRLGKSLTAGPQIQPAGYGAADLRSAYKITGSGAERTTVAVVDAFGYPNAEKDLAVYRTQMGLPPCTTGNGCFTKINQTGGHTVYPPMDVGWAQETGLDLDMVSAMCPKCRILLVQANTNFLSDLSVAENKAAALGAHVISNSYGGDEGGSSAYSPAYNHPGIAITVSSGDFGFGVEFPASSSKVTAVGGTSLLRAWNSRGWVETVWAGAGSGCSTIYAKPAWQKDPLCLKRTVADVSAIADPDTGVAVYVPLDAFTSGWTTFGGTSVAAPLVAGIYGVKADAVNYGQNPYLNTGFLFDVLTGSNGLCGGTYLCTGAPHYDGPTGLGTPNGTTAF